MAEMRRCNRCGKVLPSDALEGICLACTLRAGPEPDTRPAADGSSGENVTFSFEPVQPGHVLESLARSIGSMPSVLASRHGDRRHRFRHQPAVVRRDALARRAWRPLPALRRDRARRHGGRPQGPRPRPGPRPGRQGLARKPRGQARAGAPVRRGSADRRPAPASRHRAGLRAGRLRRPPAVFHDEAGQGPHPGGARWRNAPVARATTCPASCRIFEAVCQTMAYAHARGRDPPRPEAVERHGGQLRRGAGDGLGPGQGLEGRRRRR